MPCAAGNLAQSSNVVDIFDSTSSTWSTAVLSAARGYSRATSLPNLGLALFAGGSVSGDDSKRTLCYGHMSFCRFICFVMGYACIHGVCCADRVFVTFVLRSGQCCGHLQLDFTHLEHFNSQFSSKQSCSHVTAESRTRYLRWWLRYDESCSFELLLQGASL
jgi:hypothetical protein